MEKIILYILVCFLFTGCINDYAYVNNLPTAPVFNNKKRVEVYGSLGIAHAQGSLSVRPYKNMGICLNAFSGFQGQSYLEGGLAQKFKIKNNSWFHLAGGYGQGHTNNFVSYGILSYYSVKIAANYSQYYIQPYFSFYDKNAVSTLKAIWTMGAKLSMINFSNYSLIYKNYSLQDYYTYTIAYSFQQLNTKSFLLFLNYSVDANKYFKLQFNLGYNLIQKFSADKNKALFGNPYTDQKHLKTINLHPYAGALNYGFSLGFAL